MNVYLLDIVINEGLKQFLSGLPNNVPFLPLTRILSSFFAFFFLFPFEFFPRCSTSLVLIESAIMRGRIITAITDRGVTDCRNKHKPAPALLSDVPAAVLSVCAPDTVVPDGSRATGAMYVGR